MGLIRPRPSFFTASADSPLFDRVNRLRMLSVFRLAELLYLQFSNSSITIRVSRTKKTRIKSPQLHEYPRNNNIMIFTITCRHHKRFLNACGVLFKFFFFIRFSRPVSDGPSAAYPSTSLFVLFFFWIFFPVSSSHRG